MTKYIRILSFISAILLLFAPAISQEKIASLPDGKKVILYNDHTWAYYDGISYDFDFSQLQDNEISCNLVYINT